jgi:hypothetical protein
MLSVIDTRDPATSAHIVQHPTKPFALVRLHRTYGGREVVSLIDRYASREEAGAGLIALVRNPLHPARLSQAAAGGRFGGFLRAPSQPRRWPVV